MTTIANQPDAQFHCHTADVASSGGCAPATGANQAEMLQQMLGLMQMMMQCMQMMNSGFGGQQGMNPMASMMAEMLQMMMQSFAGAGGGEGPSAGDGGTHAEAPRGNGGTHAEAPRGNGGTHAEAPRGNGGPSCGNDAPAGGVQAEVPRAIAKPVVPAEQTLLDNFDKLKGADGLVTLQTINDVAAGGNCPDGSKASPELRAACKELRNDPERFVRAETAAPNAPKDMLLSAADLVAVLADGPKATANGMVGVAKSTDGAVSQAIVGTAVAQTEILKDATANAAELAVGTASAQGQEVRAAIASADNATAGTAVAQGEVSKAAVGKDMVAVAAPIIAEQVVRAVQEAESKPVGSESIDLTTVMTQNEDGTITCGDGSPTEIAPIPVGMPEIDLPVCGFPAAEPALTPFEMPTLDDFLEPAVLLSDEPTCILREAEAGPEAELFASVQDSAELA